MSQTPLNFPDAHQCGMQWMRCWMDTTRGSSHIQSLRNIILTILAPPFQPFTTGFIPNSSIFITGELLCVYFKKNPKYHFQPDQCVLWLRIALSCKIQMFFGAQLRVLSHLAIPVRIYCSTHTQDQREPPQSAFICCGQTNCKMQHPAPPSHPLSP